MFAPVRARPRSRARARRRFLSLAALAVAAVALVVSCAEKSPMRPLPESEVWTPEDAIRAVVHAWANRDTSAYLALLAPGSFFFSVCTEESQVYISDLHDLDGERYLAARLFRLGTESLPPATSIGISIDGPLSPTTLLEDPRSVFVDVPMTLGVGTELGTTFHQGTQFITLTRGDALSPPNPADSTHWYVDSWGEFTLDDLRSPSPEDARRLLGAVHARAAARVTAGSFCDSAMTTTWGRIKTQYLEGYTGSPFVPFGRP